MTHFDDAAIGTLRADRQFRLLVQSVTDYAIYMLDTDGHVANWNAGAERIKGYTAAEIVGRHFSVFYTPEDVERRIPWLALEAARRDGRFEAEAWRLRRDGSRFWASVVIDAIHDDGRLVGFAKVTRDLTERREAQVKLDQAREQLFQAQKAEAVGQLTGGLAHDFNNLLTGIIGSLEMFKSRLAAGRFGDLDRYITAAQASANRAASLTHRLLAFARRQTLDPRPVDANALIARMEDLIRRTVVTGMGLGIETRIALGAGLWTTLCDANQLENALLNLCLNARDAMPNGGRLTVSTASVQIDECGARERDLRPGEYVEVGVADTGTGMTDDVVARAFDPFFTTKPLGAGTGLGLSMIYGFARQSGGQAWIETKLGQGSTVRIVLPRHSGAPAEELLNSRESAGPGKSGETVMVVDDEATVRMLVMDVVADMGFAAIEAIDGASGLKVLQSDARIDLLITDIGLPGGINGRQLAEAARKVRPELKVLFMTGYAETTVIGDRQLEAGMYLLTKPFQMEALSSQIGRILKEDGGSGGNGSSPPASR